MKFTCKFKPNTTILLVAFIVFFSSCAKLPMYQSQKLNEVNNEETQNIELSHFDKKDNVHYGVANNQTDLYVQAVFHDEESLMMIMRGGLILYFDPDGKKGKDYALKIERAEKEMLDQSAIPQRSMNSRESRNENMPKLIDLMCTKVTWDNDGEDFVFYRGMQKQAIEVNLYPNENNELVLMAKMPLKELPIPDDKTISVGIATGSASGSRPSGGMQPSGRSGGGGGGGRGGGMSGGGGGGGGRSGGQKGGSQGGNASSGMSPIQIWCQVKL